MRTRIARIAAVLVALTAAGCGILDFGDDSALTRYFPLKPGSTWTYHRVMFDDTTVYTVRTTVESYKDGVAIVNFQQLHPPVLVSLSFENRIHVTQDAIIDSGDSWYNERKIGIPILRAPLRVGTTWTYAFDSGPFYKDHPQYFRTAIVNVDTVVVTPAGRFSHVIVTEMRQMGAAGLDWAKAKTVLRYYYAPGVGHIRTTAILGGPVVSSELVSYEIP